MIDLHTHVLPGIDDGAIDLEVAVSMCLAARDDGCRTVIATPHYRHPLFPTPDLGLARGLASRIQARVGPGLRILVGAEVRVDDLLVDDLLRMPYEDLPTLGASKSILLEFPSVPCGHDPAAIVHELLVAGLRPILAHPELIPWIAEDLALLRRMVKRGALLQITAGSLSGAFGTRIRNTTRELVDAGLVHLCASDCHDLERRPPGLSPVRNILTKRWDPALAIALLDSNPAAVLADEPLAAAA